MVALDGSLALVVMGAVVWGSIWWWLHGVECGGMGCRLVKCSVALWNSYEIVMSRGGIR